MAFGLNTFPNRRSILDRSLLQISRHLRRAQTLDLLRGIESMPASALADIRAAQFRRLSSLLAHAEARVPYYREIFRSIGIKSRDIRTWRDFSALPVLTKEIIRERLDDLIREDVSPRRLIKKYTSGSTGVPLTLYQDRLSSDAASAGNFRNFLRSGWRVGEVMAIFHGTYPIVSRWRHAAQQMLRSAYQFDAFHAGPEQMEQWVEQWRKLKPRIARGLPSLIARFAAHLEAAGRRVPPLRGVFTSGEKLYQHQRELITRVFGCQVYDCYGSTEVQNIASECWRGRMHVNADFVVLETEVLPFANAACRPFIVTSLWNFAMPFIRYRNEDRGALREDSCDCGNNFPLMELNIARQTDYFVLPRGRVVHGSFFVDIISWSSDSIINFQFQQTGTDAITLWIVPRTGREAKKDYAVRRTLERIKSLGLTDVEVTVREVKEIPLSISGKHRYVRSEAAHYEEPGARADAGR
jgi:phenylacetate-CoA ligase